MNLVSNSPLVVFDSYKYKVDDIGDMQKAEVKSGRFAAAILTHTLAERQYAMEHGGMTQSNLAASHDYALKKELQIMGAASRAEIIERGRVIWGYFDPQDNLKTRYYFPDIGPQ